jgi:hypothetical protein
LPPGKAAISEWGDADRFFGGVPVDFQVSAGGGVNVMDVLPTAAALKQTELAWREMYGRLFYFVVR